MRGNDRSEMFLHKKGQKRGHKAEPKEIPMERSFAVERHPLCVSCNSYSPLNRKQTVSLKTLRHPCCRKWEHTLLVNSLQCGKNPKEEDEVALSSAQQSPSVTSRSAVFME